MIDGIKIEVSTLNGNTWKTNKLLQFYTYTNVNTGELLDRTVVAKYKGLKFFITQSTKYKNRVYYSVRCSLHKYHNNGKHNANDFTFFDLQNVISELQQKFNIDPKTSVLRNIEFGVNINTPVEAKEVLKNLVSYGSTPFVMLKIQAETLGKVISKQQYKLKVYNKGKQYKQPTINLLRYEVSVKKMIFLQKHGIKTLADLQDSSKINPLGSLLLSYWDDVIYYDKAINWKQLTDFERKKILYYATPRNWADFEKKQRLRAKKHFKALMYQYSTSTTHKEIYTLIANKWNDLTAVICPPFNHDLNEDLKTQNVHLLTVSIDGYKVDKTTHKKDYINFAQKHPKKKAVLIFLIKEPQQNFAQKNVITSITEKSEPKEIEKEYLQKKRIYKGLLKFCPKTNFG